MKITGDFRRYRYAASKGSDADALLVRVGKAAMISARRGELQGMRERALKQLKVLLSTRT